MQHENDPAHNPTQNGHMRSRVKEPLDHACDALVTRFPGLTPNHVSAIGLGLTEAGTVIAVKAKKPRTKVLAGVLLTIGAVSDALDGSLKRARDRAGLPTTQKEPKTKIGKTMKKFLSNGSLVDVTADRVGEASMGAGRTIRAIHQQNTRDTAAAIAVTLTNSLPSVARAHAEAQGRVVPESTKGIGLLGNRVTRAITGITGLVIPEIKGIPVQRVLDGATTVSNLVVTTQRVNTTVRKDYAGVSLPDHLQKTGRERAKLLLTVSTGIVLAEVGIVLWANKRKSKKQK